MKIHVPDEMKQHEPQIRFFFDLMIRKLHTNRHKGFADDADPRDLFNHMEQETDELMTALREESQFNAAMEAVDVANFCLLLAMRVLSMDVVSFNQSRPAQTN